MLNKEEIEKAKEEIKETINLFYEFPNPQSVLLQDNEVQYLETLLQYIQELEISNEELDKENNRLEKIEFERDMLKKGKNSLMSSRKKWKDRYYKLKRMFNKQNKIINEMSKEINAKVLTKEQWCPLLSKEKGCYEDDTCLKCLKQYFEKKVEKDNE